MTRRGGWPLVGITAIAVGAMLLGIFAWWGSGAAGLHVALQATAVSSTLLFLCAFLAAPLHRALPGERTDWLLRNRRQLGVSFATSHAYHLGAILALGRIEPSIYETAGLLGGGLAYVFIAAMTATSFDRSAAWLGPRLWRRLHRTGLYYIWLILFVTYLGNVSTRWLSALLFTLLLAALVARVALRRRRPMVRDGVIG